MRYLRVYTDYKSEYDALAEMTDTPEEREGSTVYDTANLPSEWIQKIKANGTGKRFSLSQKIRIFKEEIITLPNFMSEWDAGRLERYFYEYLRNRHPKEGYTVHVKVAGSRQCRYCIEHTVWITYRPDIKKIL